LGGCGLLLGSGLVSKLRRNHVHHVERIKNRSESCLPTSLLRKLKFGYIIKKNLTR
jgi:hypothetical protein